MSADECVHCQRPRSVHTGILNNCPGRQYLHYRARYNADGSFVTDYEPCPVCPHCGFRDQDFWDGGYEYDDTVRVECGDCGKPFDCQGQTDITFTTTIPDLEAEAARKKEDEEREAARRREFLALIKTMPPGTRVKVPDDHRTIYRGQMGVIANKEVNRYHNFVDVDLDGGRQDFFNPRDLEVIG